MESHGRMEMKFVLDTSALWHAPLWEALATASGRGLIEDGRLQVILPAVAYAERLRQMRRYGQDVDLWKRSLDALGVEREGFQEMEAERIGASAWTEVEWRRHARDALIAAHVFGDRRAVTADEGAVWAAVDALTPPEAAAAIREIVGAGLTTSFRHELH